MAPISIRVDRLADALVAVAVDPTSAAQAVLSNAAIKRLAASSRP
jgi:hypothetical protein